MPTLFLYTPQEAIEEASERVPAWTNRSRRRGLWPKSGLIGAKRKAGALGTKTSSPGRPERGLSLPSDGFVFVPENVMELPVSPLTPKA